MLLRKLFSQCIQYFLITLWIWFNYPHEELWWNPKSQHSINVGSHDFKMHQCLKQFCEIMESHIQDFQAQAGHVYVKLRFKFLIFDVLLNVISEFLSCESIFLEYSDVIIYLCHCASNSPKLIAFRVFLIEISMANWHYSWHFDFFLMVS